jgi:hypothetical protein
MPRKKRQTLTEVDTRGSIQMEAGKWYRLDSPEITECCDCGLVHHTEYMFENGRMFWRAITDRKATRASRKRNGITVSRTKPAV